MRLLHHSKVIDVTHGICPVCVLTHFPLMAEGTDPATGEPTVAIESGEVLNGALG
jgi:hypothetical protein